MFKSKKAEAGIGTLILFIAMILVAAVAAGVLIQTSSSLQSKALATGSKAKTQVSTSASFVSLYGEDSDSDSMIEYLFAEVKLSPGSDPIKLNDSLMEFILNNDSADLDYNGEVRSCNTTVADTAGTSKYSIEMLINGSGHRQHYLQTGDVIKVCFKTKREIEEDEDMKLTFVPKTGSISMVHTSTPDVITTKKVYLYP
ncbi:MAG: archaellin/type IV pilin N-terminal domain-containing protein [Nanoarchaeota archaeon]